MHAQFVEFSSGDGELEQEDDPLRLPNPNASKAAAAHARSLETLLASKNKRLLQDLTDIRVANSELIAENDELANKLESVQGETARLRTLTEKLENDLMSVDAQGGGGKSVYGGGTSVWEGGAMGQSTAGDEDAVSDMMSMVGGGATTPVKPRGLAGLDLGKTSRTSSTPPPQGTSATPPPLGEGRQQQQQVAPPPNAAESSLLPIVTSQRDRFRQRNAELEQELRKQSDGVADLRAEVKTLQADNLKLYEKVRYMQSYASNQSDGGNASRSGAASYSMGDTSKNSLGSATNNQSGSGGGGGGRFNSRWSKDDDPELGRYRDKYDAYLNPFEAFKGREAQRAVQALNPLDRGVFALTRAVVGNRRARSAFIMYTAALVSASEIAKAVAELN